MDEIAHTILDDEEDDEQIKQRLQALDLDKEKQIPLDEIPDMDDIPDIEDDQVVEEEDPVTLLLAQIHERLSLFWSFEQ